jgi:hypothetical protein
MAAFSYSINRGQSGFLQTDFTHGTLAPNANDIELRVNTTDQNGASMLTRDIVKAIRAFERAILSEIMFGGDWGI